MNNLETAAHEIIVIADELSKLRQTIAKHSDAAKGLDSAAIEIANLAVTLRQLPEPLLAIVKHGDQFISKADQSLAPATALAETVNKYRDSFTAQQQSLVQLTQVGEQNNAVLAAVSHHVLLLATSDVLQTLDGKLDQLKTVLSNDLTVSNDKLDSLQSSVDRLIAAMNETSTAAATALKLTNEKLDNLHQVNQRIVDSMGQLANEVASGLRLSNNKTDLLQKSVDDIDKLVLQTSAKVDAASRTSEQQSINQDRQAQETTEKLLTLERLARRSLFAILLGRGEAAAKS